MTEPSVQEDGALSVDSCWSQCITDTSSNFVRKLATSPSALKFQVPARRALLVAFPCDAGRREFEAPLRLVEELVPTLSRLAKDPRRSLPWAAGGEAPLAASAVAYCVPVQAVASMSQLRQGATEKVALDPKNVQPDSRHRSVEALLSLHQQDDATAATADFCGWSSWEAPCCKEKSASSRKVVAAYCRAL